MIRSIKVSGWESKCYSSLLCIIVFYVFLVCFIVMHFVTSVLGRCCNNSRAGKADERKMSPELRCGLGRVCPLSSPAWWDGWRNCCWEASRWDGWYRLSREWRKFTCRKEERNREEEKNNDLIGYVTQQCRCLTTAICYYHDLNDLFTTTIWRICN